MTYFEILLTQLDKKRTFIYILIVGIALRTVASLLMAKIPLVSDAENYYWNGAYLYWGKDFVPYWPPGLPYYLRVMFELFGDTQAVSRLAMIFFYPLLMVPLFLWLKSIINIRAANVAALIFTFYPNYIYHATLPLTQLPVAALVIIIGYLTYLLVYRVHELNFLTQMSALILLGLGLGIIALIRANSLILLGFIPIYILYQTRRILLVIVPLLIAGVLLTIYLTDIYKINNAFVLINYSNSYNFFVGNHEDTPLYRTWLFASDKNARTERFSQEDTEIRNNFPHVQDRLFQRAALDNILSRPDLFVIRTLSRIRAYFGFDTYTGTRLIAEDLTGTIPGLFIILIDAFMYLLVMIPAILFLILRDKIDLQRKIPVFFICGIALLYALPYFVAFAHPTYHFPIVPLFGIFAAAFYNAISHQHTRQEIYTVLRDSRWKLAIVILVIFLLIQIEWGIIMFSEFTKL